jgi:hypothetical protein
LFESKETEERIERLPDNANQDASRPFTIARHAAKNQPLHLEPTDFMNTMQRYGHDIFVAVVGM